MVVHVVAMVVHGHHPAAACACGRGHAIIAVTSILHEAVAMVVHVVHGHHPAAACGRGHAVVAGMVAAGVVGIEDVIERVLVLVIVLIAVPLMVTFVVSMIVVPVTSILHEDAARVLVFVGSLSHPACRSHAKHLFGARKLTCGRLADHLSGRHTMALHRKGAVCPPFQRHKVQIRFISGVGRCLRGFLGHHVGR